MRITALDLAAQTGLAFGEGDKPSLETWDLSGAGGLGDRGLRLMRRLVAHIDAYKPEKGFIERPMSAAVMVDMGATMNTQLSLTGYAVLAMTIFASRRIPTELVDPQHVRQHFVGRAKFPVKGEGKRAVYARCRQLGWSPENDNESDAAALWDYGCSHSNPRSWLIAAGNRAAMRR